MARCAHSEVPMRLPCLVAAAGLLGCSSSAAEPAAEPATDPSDDFEIVPEGKEDNYRSPTAMEFSATGLSQVTLEAKYETATDAERADAARELASAKLLQIGWFLNLWVSDKEPEDANKGYGGFHAMARNSSVQALEIKPKDKLVYELSFDATIAAKNDLLSVMPGTSQPGGAKLVELKMGKVSNDALLGGTWQSGYSVHGWDPSKVDPAQLETVTLTVKPIERSSNAYLNYAALYADGRLEVGAQFGWDYNEGRQDLANARQLYNDLLAIGFSSPVANYDELTLQSGALTRDATYAGKSVKIEVKLVHPGMVPSASANAVDLRNALLDLLATREVILFNGHAGVSGRLLPADFRSTSAGNILPTEYPTLKLLPGYQLFLIEGCQTYARFTDGFRQNPAKRGPNGELVNMDIVTSTSYTWTSQGAEMMEAILFPLVGKSAATLIKPATWDDVLRTMNAPPNDTAFMGVNGIEGDPRAHPYARLDLLGTSCKTSAACGGEGNVCSRTPKTGTGKVCATVCLDDVGCPADYRCTRLASSGAIVGRACVKR
jgi:hypothetical protein